MEWLLLIAITLAATGIWPLGRWALREDGDPGVVGFWVSLTVAALCALGASMTGEWRNAPADLWVAGGAMGVAYSVGFWICTMRALQIGPAGPTATINNMAMVAGVLYGLLVLTPGRATAWTWAGVAGVCLALLLLGARNPAGNGVRRSTGASWARLMAMGGLLSCLSFVAQTHVGTLHPTHRFLFGAVGFGASALLLLPRMLRRPASFGVRRELFGGVALGAVNGAVLPLTLQTIRQLGAEVVLPVTVATPILLVLVIGRLIYGERLSAVAWIACAIGALSVAALSYGGSA